MLNLLRKIRRREFKGRYLKYAFGEILLVVVGILIALSINNWNDERKRQKNIKAILIEIQADLDKDMGRAGELLERYLLKDSIFKLMVTDQLTEEDYLNTHYDRGIDVNFAYWYDDFEISDNAYLKYKSLIGQNSSLDDSLTNLLDDMFVPLKNNIEVYNERIRNTVYGNIDYLAKNKDWYYEWHSFASKMISPDYLDFFLHDHQYKNQAANYINDYHNMVQDTQTFRIKALIASILISKRLGTRDAPYRRQLFFEPDEASTLVGSYRLKSEGLSIYEVEKLVITVDNNRLYLRRGEDKIRLYRHSDELFYSAVWQDIYRFEFNGDEESVTVIVMSERGNHRYHKTNT